MLIIVLAGVIVLVLSLTAALWTMTAMPGPRHREYRAAPNPEDDALARRLQAHVKVLASDIGPRPAEESSALRQTTDYIEKQFAALGYRVRRQRIEGDDFGFPNLEVEVPGTVPAAPLLVIGAHYDTVPYSPGADDNASAVAVLFELARALHGRKLARPVRLVAFADEERGFAGSRFYAADLHAHGVQVAAMLSLEMLGFFSDAEGSQQYPLSAFRWLYPDRGNYVGFVGNLASRSLVRRCVGTFRKTLPFPCEGVAAPELLRDIGRSDNIAFWLQGYPAVMVTDTANYRNPHYHQMSDVPDTLDYARMAKVTRGLLSVVESLASYP